MAISGVVIAMCRVAAVFAVAGVLAMHVLTTGHHAELPVAGEGGTGGHHAAMVAEVTSDATSLPLMTFSPGPASPGDLVGACMAVLLVAATTLLFWLARHRDRSWPWSAASAFPRWASHVPRPRPPSLFTLGVLRI